MCEQEYRWKSRVRSPLMVSDQMCWSYMGREQRPNEAPLKSRLVLLITLREIDKFPADITKLVCHISARDLSETLLQKTWFFQDCPRGRNQYRMKLIMRSRKVFKPQDCVIKWSDCFDIMTPGSPASHQSDRINLSSYLAALELEDLAIRQHMRTGVQEAGIKNRDK